MSETTKISVTCRHCSQKFRLKSTLIGKRIRCPECSLPFRVAADEGAAGASVTPPPSNQKNRQAVHSASRPVQGSDVGDTRPNARVTGTSPELRKPVASQTRKKKRSAARSNQDPGQLITNYRMLPRTLFRPLRASFLCPNSKCSASLSCDPEDIGTPDFCPSCGMVFTLSGTVMEDYLRETNASRDASTGNKASGTRHRTFLKSAVRGSGQLWTRALSEVNRAIDEADRIRIRESLTFGRSSSDCDWVLPGDDVCPQHFQIREHDGKREILDLGSQSGTRLNEVQLQPGHPVELVNGDRVEAGRQIYELDGDYLKPVAGTQHAHLLCHQWTKNVFDEDGRSKTLLCNVTLDIHPGTFVVIMGPSGCGKSTLMNALSGRNQPTSGQVIFNEQDLQVHFDTLKKRMAFVPQKDLLYERLTLTEALSFTAELRLSNDLSAEERDHRVQQSIDQVEMDLLANTVIGKYSGGQIKRASLANELISSPSLLFIDEATSGLDEHSDREIMQMLRSLADSGKTIICITHNLAHVHQFAHQVISMAQGGHVAFVGSPEETLDYFGLTGLHDLYGRLLLGDRTAEQWGAEFEKQPRYQAMETAARKRMFRTLRPMVTRQKVTVLQKLGVFLRHTLVTGRRNILLQLSDKRALLTAMFQPILVSALIVILFGDVTTDVEDVVTQTKRFQSSLMVLFLLSVSSFWFGCNNAAKEIVREKHLFERERNAGLNAVAYLMSKFLLLSLFTSCQSVFLYGVVSYFTKLQGNDLASIATLLATGICGVALGLTISAISSDTDVAATAVPIAIIPQVILAGAIKPVENIAEDVSRILAPAYWSYGMLSRNLDLSLDSQLVHLSLPETLMTSQKDLQFSGAMILAFAAICLLISGIRLSGVKVHQFSSSAELEIWLRESLTGRNRSR